MKKLLNIGIAVFIHLHILGQNTLREAAPDPNYDELFSHTSCVTAREICSTENMMALFPSKEQCDQFLVPQYFKLYFSGAGNFDLNTYSHTGNYTLSGPMSSFGVSACNQISLGQVNFITGNLSGLISLPHQAGYYILQIHPNNCVNIEGSWGFRMQISSRVLSCPEKAPDCKDCIGSFSPEPGKYILSAWVKGEAQNKNSSYENPKIEVSFPGFPGTYPFPPAGKIIDDWQRIDGIVTIPPGATDIIIKLDCQTGTCYFDDIRFVPINGSMISYVYDPTTLKLTAQLDERNYATFYEYDEEGKLIRVKKETERGIMTIQENRDNIHKK